MDAPDDAARVVLVTAPDAAVALHLARALVAEDLLACANLVPAVTSVYRWQGAVMEDAEVLLIGKTLAGRMAELEKRLLELHPYDVPELIALAPTHVEERYLAWLRSATA